jgi:hypothetical protein
MLVMMGHANPALLFTSGPHPRRLRRIRRAATPHLQRSELHLQLRHELRIQRRNLRGRRRELLALVREPHELQRGLPRFVQP